MTFEDASRAVVYARGISHGFIQQYIGLDEKRGPRNAGGGFEIFHEFRQSFRVVIWADKKHADIERADLREAIEAAFAKVGVAMPNLEPEPFE